MTVLLGLLPHPINRQGAAKFHVTKQKLHFCHHHDAVVKKKAPGVSDAGRFDRLASDRVAARYRFSQAACLGLLEVSRGLLAALGHHFVADLLALDEGAHAGALDRTDVHEHVLAAVARLDESEAFLGIEELHGTCGHHGLLALYALSETGHANVARRVIRVLGAS
jgi:hypothetical protein